MPAAGKSRGFRVTITECLDCPARRLFPLQPRDPLVFAGVEAALVFPPKPREPGGQGCQSDEPDPSWNPELLEGFGGDLEGRRGLAGIAFLVKRHNMNGPKGAGREVFKPRDHHSFAGTKLRPLPRDPCDDDPSIRGAWGDAPALNLEAGGFG